MANESTTFGFATFLVLAGLAVMLYGVTLNHGAALNTPIAIGGTIVVAGIGVLTAGIMRADGGHAAEEH